MIFMKISSAVVLFILAIFVPALIGMGLTNSKDKDDWIPVAWGVASVFLGVSLIMNFFIVVGIY